jgi:hypothetical protein
MELVFANSFTAGHRTSAMDKLRVPKKKKKVRFPLFRLGFNLGLSLCMLVDLWASNITQMFQVASIYLLGIESTSSFPSFESVAIVYRMLAMLVLLIWGWGIDMYAWTKYKINYVFIFEFNARHYERWETLFEVTFVIHLTNVGCFHFYCCVVCKLLSLSNDYSTTVRIAFLAGHSLANTPSHIAVHNYRSYCNFSV